MLTGRSGQARLRREVLTDHEAHGQAGAAAEEQKRICRALRGALAGGHPRGRCRQREARSHSYSGEPTGETRDLSERGPEQDRDVHKGPERINDLHALHVGGGTAGQSSRPRTERE